MLGLLFVVLVIMVGLQLKSSTATDYAEDENDESIYSNHESEFSQNYYLEFINEYMESQLTTIFNSSADSSKLYKLDKELFSVPKIQSNQKIVSNHTPQKPSKNNFKLYGILWDKKTPSAIINNEIVHVGSRLGLFKVSRIFPHKVYLTSKKQTLILTIPVEQTDN